MVCMRLNYFQAAAADRLNSHLSSTLQKFVGHPPTPIDDYFLETGHWALQKYHKAMLARPLPPPLHLNKVLVAPNLKCWQQSLRIATKKGRMQQWMAGTHQEQLQADELIAFPGLRELSTRQWDVLQSLNADSLPEKVSRLIDVTQQSAMASPATESAHCLTPKGVQFDTKRCRRMIGLEALRLQNIWYPDHDRKFEEMLQGLDETAFEKQDRFLVDLSGNAFETHCCSAVLMAAFIAIGMAKAEETEDCFSGSAGSAAQHAHTADVWNPLSESDGPDCDTGNPPSESD
jgi:hypothetical protein